MTNEELLSVAEIVERLVTRFHEQLAEHEAKMVEHRAAFGVRTTADAKIIAGLRGERNWLRAEVAALQERLRASIARGDLAQMKVAALKSQTPKHPVRVGEYVTWRGSPGVLGGTIKQVAEIRGDRAYRFTDGGVWSFALCEPCDPPATHDTEAGKAAAKTVIRDSRSGEIEMCVGDEVEVIGRSVPTPTSGMFTGTIAPIGTRGTVKMIHGTAGFVELDNGTRASIQDVRKVTT